MTASGCGGRHTRIVEEAAVIYLLIAIVVWLAGLGWMWWAARHAPEMYDGEQTHPPRDE